LKPVLALAAACLLASAVFGADTAVRLGDASVRFDRARWQASAAHDSISFTPQGDAARELDPVVLRVVAGEQPCAALAETAFSIGHYDIGGIERSPMRVGGVSGERFIAHTGCRNATPRGVVACAKVAGRTSELHEQNHAEEERRGITSRRPAGGVGGGIYFSGAG
jgi:hypothetical protein